jgi:geranylgeranyl diphosphate synthase type 3
MREPNSHKAHKPDESLLESFRYINSVPGKDVRGKLIDCFQLWFQVESETTLLAIKDIVGSLHNASLLIDDIEDNSKLRRGVPVAHKIFGVPTVINTANYVCYLAMEQCFQLDNRVATQVFLGEILNLHRGQGQDIAWRDACKCPSEDDYLKMVQDKTGGLFRLAVGLLQAFASQHSETDFTPLVNYLAEYFQIRDDFINLADEEYMKSKSFCEDLTEGKFSFPIIHCIHQDLSDTRLISILKQHTEDVDIKRYAQKLMKEAGSLDYTRSKCSQLKLLIEEEIAKFGGNPSLSKVLDLLHVQLEAINMPSSESHNKSDFCIDDL